MSNEKNHERHKFSLVRWKLPKRANGMLEMKITTSETKNFFSERISRMDTPIRENNETWKWVNKNYPNLNIKRKMGKTIQHPRSMRQNQTTTDICIIGAPGEEKENQAEKIHISRNNGWKISYTNEIISP